MKYIFKEQNQSPWIVESYNYFLPYKTDGYFVEIGVGHTIKGIDKEEVDPNIQNFIRHGSNTADLLDLGWSGIYIEPVYEYCEEAKICHKNNLDRLIVVNAAASNIEEEIPLYLGESFIPNSYGSQGYKYVGRVVQTKKTSDILKQYNCPYNIDVLSIDVEGFEDRVLLGLDFNLHKPKLIICEINVVPIERISKILPDGYKCIGRDNLNAVWVNV